MPASLIPIDTPACSRHRKVHQSIEVSVDVDTRVSHKRQRQWTPHYRTTPNKRIKGRDALSSVDYLLDRTINRDSPGGALIALGKLLATRSRPMSSSSPSPESLHRPERSAIRLQKVDSSVMYDNAESDDDLLSAYPRLSLPIDIHDHLDDDKDLQSPLSTDFSTDKHILFPVEIPRRDTFSANIAENQDFNLAGGLYQRPDRNIASNVPTATIFQANVLMERPLIADELGSENMTLAINLPTDLSSDDHESDFGLHIPSVPQEDEITSMLGSEIDRSDGPGRNQGDVLKQHSDIANIELTETTFQMPISLEDTLTTEKKNDLKSQNIATFRSTSNDHDEFEDVAVWRRSPSQDGGYFGFESSPILNTSNGKLPSSLVGSDIPMSWSRRRLPTLSPRVSLHGVRYALIPVTFIQKMAHSIMRTQGCLAAKFEADVIAHLADVSDWFLQQISADLDAYAFHAGRTVINESDVNLLLTRQAIVSSKTTLFSLYDRYLPKEMSRQLKTYN